MSGFQLSHWQQTFLRSAAFEHDRKRCRFRGEIRNPQLRGDEYDVSRQCTVVAAVRVPRHVWSAMRGLCTCSTSSGLKACRTPLLQPPTCKK